MTAVDSRPVAPRPERPKYVRAVGPKLRILLYVVFALVALLGANSVYLVSITALEWATGLTYQDFFYQCMFLLHLGLGLLLLAPFLLFGVLHLVASRKRKNKRAIRIGYALFGVSIALLASGLLLMRVGGFDLRLPAARSAVYWLHVGSPLAALWLYWLHRLAGPRIKWRLGIAYGGAVAALVVAMLVLKSQDPRQWYTKGPTEGKSYFEPSLVVTQNGKLLSAETMMMDDYCLKCHKDAFDGWFHSSHRFSSFNNPAYLASVRETREVSFKRDGNMKAARWCAGCHDPVPFLSGAFDNKDYDDVNDPTAQAGITCTVCHAITNVNSTRGNADYTIEEPLHYPFAYSKNPWLQYVNNQLVKAKPSFHKKTFLKPFHKTAEFCSTCHKVHLPKELNNYKEFLRGQNHYDAYLLSGVSGHGARSFYYPEKAQANCAGCHMPLQASDDFGAKLFAGADQLSIHNHLFASANTGVPFLRGDEETVKAHQAFLKDNVRVDIFGIKIGQSISGEFSAPLRPTVPALKPGGKYLLETVIRTLKLGHLFTQGTVDSNEVWLDVTVSSNGQVIGRSGGIGLDGTVDPWSHFVNVFLLDRDGNRINRRNPQDIFTPLYNHQIPPGAGQVAHFGMELPSDLSAPVTVEVKLQYRKFDQEYMAFVTKSAKPGDKPFRGFTVGQKEPYRNELPITTMAMDKITFPVEGVAAEVENPKSEIPLWQRWNDYGIGLLLEGSSSKGELRQAYAAFAEVEKLGRFDGPLNLARAYQVEGLLDEAVDAIARANKHTDPAPPPWTMAWLSGLINRQQGHLDSAIDNFQSVLSPPTEQMKQRNLDFRLDYDVINELGLTFFDRSKQEVGPARQVERRRLQEQAVEQFQKTLQLDSENVTAHFNLSLLYDRLGDAERSAEHKKLHARYKEDDNARDRAFALARKKYPAANHAAEALVIYPLNRVGAPELPVAAAPTAKPASTGGGQ